MYCTQQVDEHNTSLLLVPYGHNALTERQKLGYLLKGIKCKKLKVVKVQIMATDVAARTYTVCACQFADYITNIVMDNPHALSEVGTERNHDKPPRGPWRVPLPTGSELEPVL